MARTAWPLLTVEGRDKRAALHGTLASGTGPNFLDEGEQ